MGNMLSYRGYHAKIEFDAEDMILVGSVFGVRDSLNFHGKDTDEITQMFHQCIDNYLELCAELGRQPDKEFKGSFNVRIDPDLHRRAALEAERNHIPLNQYVEQAIQAAVNKMDSGPIYAIPMTPMTVVQPKWSKGEVVSANFKYDEAIFKQYRI